MRVRLFTEEQQKRGSGYLRDVSIVYSWVTDSYEVPRGKGEKKGEKEYIARRREQSQMLNSIL